MIEEKLNESYALEYSDLLDINKALDQRATMILTISGIFLAGLFAIANSASGSICYPVKCFMIISLILLLAEVILIITATFIGKYIKPPLGTGQYELLRDILSEIKDTQENERYKRFLLDCCTAWELANKDLDNKNKKKAIIILISQINLATIVLLSIIAIIIRIN